MVPAERFSAPRRAGLFLYGVKKLTTRPLYILLTIDKE